MKECLGVLTYDGIVKPRFLGYERSYNEYGNIPLLSGISREDNNSCSQGDLSNYVGIYHFLCHGEGHCGILIPNSSWITVR